jgi:hypothetical protein
LFLDTGIFLDGNLFQGNQAEFGGGMGSSGIDSDQQNSVLIDNFASQAGSGMWIHQGTNRIYHATISGNTGGDGTGIYAGDLTGGSTTIFLTNTILVSQTVGISLNEIGGSEVNAEVAGILVYNLTDFSSGNGSIVVTDIYTGTPAFTPDGYHLTSDSTAIDLGLETPVLEDIDGEQRPNGSANDLGADEFYPPLPIAPSQITISGPSSTEPDKVEVFLATVSPVSVTLPLTFTWEASDHVMVTHNSGITDTSSYSWSNPGLKFITVTVSNPFGTVLGTHTTEVQSNVFPVYLPVVMKTQ